MSSGPVLRLPLDKALFITPEVKILVPCEILSLLTSK